MREFLGVTVMSVGLILLAFAVVFVIALPARAVDHYFEVKNCRNYAKETGRTTEFKDVSFWSYGCFTPASDGKLINIDQLINVTD